MVITCKIIYVITPHVSSCSFSVKMINHNIHMNCFNELLKEVFLLYLKKWTETFWLFKSGEKPFAFIWLRWKNCWRLITYFACKLIHVITPHVSSFSFSVKMIKHKIHMNCFKGSQVTGEFRIREKKYSRVRLNNHVTNQCCH